MADLKEQCIFIKLCFKLWKTASEMHEMLKTAFGHNVMQCTPADTSVYIKHDGQQPY
jgi:hypothetical protein